MVHFLKAMKELSSDPIHTEINNIIPTSIVEKFLDAVPTMVSALAVDNLVWSEFLSEIKDPAEQIHSLLNEKDNNLFII